MITEFAIVALGIFTALLYAWSVGSIINLLIKGLMLALVALGVAALNGAVDMSVFTIASLIVLFGFGLVWSKDDRLQLVIKVVLGLVFVWGLVVVL